jgi:cyclohexanecarboxylate-CoA ligase
VRSLRLVSSGGAGVTPAFVASASSELGARVKRTYGSTEAPTITTSGPDDPVLRAAETDGRPTGEAEVRISDPVTGRICGPGVSGEVWVRGPELFVGYADPVATREAFARGGWFRTGDLGVLDTDGWLTIVGRIKDVIIRGGENIASAHVESALLRHPDVRNVAVVARPDADLGERVAAAVELDPASSISAEELAEFARTQLPRNEVPSDWWLLKEQLPMTEAGKVDKRKLNASWPANGAGHD